MLNTLLAKLLGTRYDRERKKLAPIVAQIKTHEAVLAGYTEEQLKGQTAGFRARLHDRVGAIKAELEEVRQLRHDCADPVERDKLEDRFHAVENRLKKETAAFLDEILPEAFATVREACRRLLGSTVMVTGREMVWDMVPYDVQLIGGVVLHRGRIAEMATGEGKTLVATLPLYLNGLTGRGVHLVTVNNYLARRDSQWMGHVFSYLGLTVRCLDDTEPSSPERRAAYAADITYGTNNEFGFDYLRDNMVFSLDQRVQREHAYAIIDEVDSILIDEARTPLIISGAVGNEGDDKYAQSNRQVAELVKKQSAVVSNLLAEGEPLLENPKTLSDGALKLYIARLGMPKNKKLLKLLNEPGIKSAVQRMELEHIADRKLPMRQQSMRELEEALYFVLDEKGHSVHLTDRGAAAMSPNDPSLFLVPDISEEVHRIDRDPGLTPEERVIRRREVESEYAIKSEKLHIIHKLLQAHALYEKEVDYLVQDGQVMIVDEFTGRIMAGRRWADGLHQAVEAKEGVQVKGETQTLATITIQNYFRMYDKLSGMTGTAETEEQEFYTIYGLEVSIIPTNRPVRRRDEEDQIYKTRREKTNAAPGRAAGADRHGHGGDIGDPLPPAQAAGPQARGPQRQVSPAGSGNRGPGGPARVNHHRDQHGRPRHRHQTRRGRGQAGGHRRAADRGHRAARVAPHRPPAAGPRRPPGRSWPLAVLPLPGRRPDAAVRVRSHRPVDGQGRGGGGRSDLPSLGDRRDQPGPEAGGAAELPGPQAAARV
jgi:preprotein translocase subunit SecA